MAATATKKKSGSKRRTSPKYTLCYEMYINSQKNASEIAKITGVSSSLISRWSREDDWDSIRVAKSVTRNNIISQVYINIKDLQEKAKDEGRAINSKESDQIYKLACTIEKMDQKLSLHHFITCMEEFMDYMRDVNPVLNKQMADYYNDFIQGRAQLVR